MFAGAYAADVGTDLHRAFSAFPLLKEADLAVINLEGPLTARGEKVPKPFNFRMPPATTADPDRGGGGCGLHRQQPRLRLRPRRTF